MEENHMIEDYGSIKWFCLYELEIPDRVYPQLLLMRIELPYVSNNNLKGQDLGETIAEYKRDRILSIMMKEWNATKYRLVGYCDSSPEGDDFYEDNGRKWIEFWVCQTCSLPWMIFAQADNIDEVHGIIDGAENEEWTSLGPIYPATKYVAWFVTENDFQLSSIMVLDQCINLVNKAETSLVFTYNYILNDYLLQKGWTFEKVYDYQALLSEELIITRFESERIPYQGTIEVRFYARRNHISFISEATETNGTVVVVGFGADFGNSEELKCILDYLYHFQEVLEDDYKTFIGNLREEGIQTYWEVEGKEIEKILRDTPLINPYENTLNEESQVEKEPQIQRIALSLPSKVQVVWNVLCDIEVEHAVNENNKYDSYFTSDLLLLKDLKENRYLDVGWYPDMDLSGEYSLTLKKEGEEEECYYEYKSRELAEITEEIQSILSIWSEIEVEKLIPLRVATGWEILFNQWYRSGIMPLSEEQGDSENQLLFHAIKKYHGQIHITASYCPEQVGAFFIQLYEEESGEIVQSQTTHIEAIAITIVEELMDKIEGVLH